LKRKRDQITDLPTSENNCGICLEPVSQSDRGKLNSCDHFFCLYCIAEWSKVTNKCPLCKRRFNVITGIDIKENSEHKIEILVLDSEQLFKRIRSTTSI